MLQTIHAIALRTVRHDDRHSILTAWTAEFGRLGILIPAGASREARRRRALLMPLSLFEAVVDIRPGRNLYNIHDVRPLTILPTITADPSKAAVALFCAEMLEKALRESPADPLLTSFIFKAIEHLDSLSPRGVAAFPIVLMARLAAFLGIEPDGTTWQPGYILDIYAGRYRPTPPVDSPWLSDEEAKIAVIIQRLTFATADRFPFSRTMRRKALDRIIQYYSIHLVPLDLRSLDVLRSIY